MSQGAIERYNKMMLEVLKTSPSITIWSSIQTLVNERLDGMMDGIHAPKDALYQAIQVIQRQNKIQTIHKLKQTCISPNSFD